MIFYLTDITYVTTNSRSVSSQLFIMCYMNKKWIFLVTF